MRPTLPVSMLRVSFISTFLLYSLIGAPLGHAFQPSASRTVLSINRRQWLDSRPTASHRARRLPQQVEGDLISHGGLVSTLFSSTTTIDAFHHPSGPFHGVTQGVSTVWKHVWGKLQQYKSCVHVDFRSIRRIIAILCISFALTFAVPPAWAVSGGRMGGGSFKSSPSRSSMGRTSTLSRPSPSRGRVQMLPPRMQSPPVIINSFGNRWYAPTHSTAIENTRVTVKDIAVMTGAGALLVYSMRNNYKNRLREADEDAGPLGAGYTVGSLTVALDVPNRGDPDNILSKLSRLSATTDTFSRKGVQDMLSEVSMELLRQEKSVTSAFAQSRPFSIAGQAEREFQVQSVQSQSKVDRLTVNKFGSQDKSVSSALKGTSSSPTVAIVTINFAIEGSATKMPSIQTRSDLRQALSRLASDALVGECLLSAEVLWSPEDTTETLSREAAYADFPNLAPI